MKDDIRPRGTVEVRCRDCRWFFWVGALDKRLPDGPFVCMTCNGEELDVPRLKEELEERRSKP